MLRRQSIDRNDDGEAKHHQEQEGDWFAWCFARVEIGMAEAGAWHDQRVGAGHPNQEDLSRIPPNGVPFSAMLTCFTRFPRAGRSGELRALP